MNLVERIEELCQEQGMSVRKLSILCGFDPSTIRKWKDHAPNYEKLKKVADLLQTTPEYLIDGVQENVPPFGYYLNPKTVMKARQLYLEGIVFDAGRNATPEELEMVAQMIRTLKDKNEDG